MVVLGNVIIVSAKRFWIGGHLIVLVQGGLHVLAELEPRELLLGLVDRVFQIPPVLKVFEKCSSQPLPSVKDRAAKDPVPRLLCRYALEAALPLPLLYNKAANIRPPPANDHPIYTKIADFQTRITLSNVIALPSN
jgi:hypothetical protein